MMQDISKRISEFEGKPLKYQDLNIYYMLTPQTSILSEEAKHLIKSHMDNIVEKNLNLNLHVNIYCIIITKQFRVKEVTEEVKLSLNRTLTTIEHVVDKINALALNDKKHLNKHFMENLKEQHRILLNKYNYSVPIDTNTFEQQLELYVKAIINDISNEIKIILTLIQTSVFIRTDRATEKNISNKLFIENSLYITHSRDEIIKLIFKKPEIKTHEGTND